MPVNTERPISNTKIFDSLLVLKNAGLVASSAAAPLIVELGQGRYPAELVIDVTALEIASNDEAYTIIAQFSDSPTFASGIVNGVSLRLAAAGVANGGAGASSVGRYVVPISNIVNGVQYGFMRLFTLVSGTIATGIDYTAYLSKQDGYPN
jgi:hypothetical protein